MSGNEADVRGSTSRISNEPESDWTTLATELLMMILNNLKGDMDISPILNSRLVHPRWKLVMDDLLEKWCLEYWTEWTPDYSSFHPNRYNVPTNLRENLLYDRPSLTKFVCLLSKLESEKVIRNDFTKYGDQLTSISFWGIGGYNSLRKFVEILNWTPNLKAIVLNGANFKIADSSGVDKIVLPSLPHLVHLKLWAVGLNSAKSPNFNFVGWLLKPYLKQLVTFETDDSFVWNQNDGELVCENLKWLKIWPPSTELLKAEIGFPSVQRLSLGWQNAGPRSLQLVQKFVSRFSETLTELYLNINYSFPRTYAKGKTGNKHFEDEEFGPSITNFTFPLLKTFWIFFPKTEEEVRVVKDFLKMFPALETLKLLLKEEEDSDLSCIDWDHPENHLMEQQYWTFCPSLKTIRILVGEGGHEIKYDPIYCFKAPFADLQLSEALPLDFNFDG